MHDRTKVFYCSQNESIARPSLSFILPLAGGQELQTVTSVGTRVPVGRGTSFASFASFTLCTSFGLNKSNTASEQCVCGASFGAVAGGD